MEKRGSQWWVVLITLGWMYMKMFLWHLPRFGFGLKVWRRGLVWSRTRACRGQLHLFLCCVSWVCCFAAFLSHFNGILLAVPANAFLFYFILIWHYLDLVAALSFGLLFRRVGCGKGQKTSFGGTCGAYGFICVEEATCLLFLLDVAFCCWMLLLLFFTVFAIGVWSFLYYLFFGCWMMGFCCCVQWLGELGSTAARFCGHPHLPAEANFALL